MTRFSPRMTHWESTWRNHRKMKKMGRSEINRELDRDRKWKKTMGRKKTISYGLYAGYGFVSPNLAAQTGFDEVDLEIFREAFKICLNMNTVPLVEE